MHVSLKLDTPIEFINVTPLNPLISKCQIKVCYVGDEPNRNRSIITKDVAKELANSIPGSPIVGFYNTATGDFEEHNRIIDISNGKFEVKDTTRPYGFVSMDAKVWFQKFEDDGVVHEYLMTEGYLWTGQYPECQRVVQEGNNHSMELDEDFLDAYWTKDSNGKPQFFIINEAIMSKLCILGENVEPCFEGSSITKVQFAFEDEFKESLFSFMNQMKEILSEGGAPVFNRYAVEIGDSLWTAIYSNMDYETYSIDGIYEDNGQTFAVLQNRNEKNFYRMNFSFNEDNLVVEELTEMTDYTQAEEAQFALVDVENFEIEFKKKKDEEEKEDESSEEDEKKPEDKKKGAFPPKSEDKDEDSDDDEEDDKNKKKKKYNLEEIEEYTSLKAVYDELVTKFNALTEENKTLVEFKQSIEREQKKEMINTFYMLDEEDKKDVIENIDKYSLDDIEAKLSVICVRKKVSFAQEEEPAETNPVTYNLDNHEDDSIPAWIKAVMDTEKSLK